MDSTIHPRVRAERQEAGLKRSSLYFLLTPSLLQFLLLIEAGHRAQLRGKEFSKKV